ncbi:MAG: SulP family inorganic anion transporter [Lewinella sp.]|nr:SulP family inorganic anion transporter [Lewinella sp.]
MNLKVNLKRYRASLRADLLGGLLAAIIGLPMGLAFGVQSGLGPQAGIYTAIILAIVASVFGGTKTLITDPTGPMTVVAATVVSLSLAQAGDLDNAWPLIVGTFVLAGLFEMVFGIFDFGKYVKFMPYPVLSGFMAGIGVIIVSVQLFPLLGHASPKGFLNILTHLHEPLADLNVQALLLGGLTIATVYLFPLLTRRVPSILVAIILGTVVSVALGLEVPVIGEIPRQLPQPHFGDLLRLHWSDIEIILTPAIMLGGLGVIDSLLTSVVADNLTKTKHNSRWTVIGQGVGNLITAFFGGIPGAGATMGTVTNIKAGAQTELSGVMKGVFLLMIVVGVADYVQYIPMSVLAGILITIGVGIIDYKGVRMLFKVPKQDAIVWSIVLLVTLFDNLLDAVGVGFALSAILFIGRMSKTMTERQQAAPLHEVLEAHPLPAGLADKIIVKNLEGPLFFGFADRFRYHCESIKEGLIVILKMDAVPFLDQSGIVTLESVIQDWHHRGIQVYIVGANAQVRDSLEKVKVLPELVNASHCFRNLDDCLGSLERKVADVTEHVTYEEVLLDKHILENRSRLVTAN